MVLQPARVLSADTRQSFPLAELPQPRAVPSTALAHVAPRRLRAPDSRAAAWTPRPGSRTPPGRVAVRRRGHSHLHWRVGCCRAPTRAWACVGARPRGWSAAGQRSRRLSFPSRGSPYTGTFCDGCRSRGSTSMPSSWCRRAYSSLSWLLASASLSSHARRWSSALRWRGAGSDEELLDAVATQTLHFRVGSWRRTVRALELS
jgi:hypothetical protein